MEVVSCAVNNKGDEEWIKEVHLFNKVNCDKYRIIENSKELESKEKITFFEAIFSKLQHTENSTLKFELLQAIRFSSRDETVISTISSIENLNYFLTLARNFDITKELTNDEEKIFSEVVKVIVNICLKNRDNSIIFNACKTLEFVDFSLSTLTKEHLSPNTKFPFCRLLFNFCLDKTIKEFLLDKQILHLIFSALKKLNVSDEGERIFAIELLDLLYVCTTHLGPLDGPTLPTDDQLATFNELVEIFQEYLFIPIEEFKYLKLKENTIKCLINVPSSSTDKFEPEKTLHSLLSFLVYHLTYNNANTATVIVPVLINLTAIARAIPRSRPIILNTVFPDWENFDLSENGIDPPAQLGDPSTTQGRFVSYITASGTAVSHCVSDFIFALCGDDGDTYVRFVGMGYAAGLLSNRGLLGSVSSIAAKSKKTKSTKEMTEEDAKQLYELMERLERGGMIKVVRSENNNNNNEEEDE